MMIPVGIKVMSMKSILHAVVFDDITNIIEGEKLPFEIKRAIQCETMKNGQLPDQERMKTCIMKC